MIGRLIHVHRDERGTTVLEFAIILPAFMLLLLGCFDIGYQVYLTALLNGEIQKSARDATLETKSLAALDSAVKTQIRQLAPTANIAVTRVAYQGYKDIGRAETFSDGNANGKCDHNEPYTDENGNGTWDRDLGKQGNGGARDVVKYNIAVTYKALFPMWKFLGSSEYRTLNSTMLLKNQPFSDQTKFSPVNRTCA